MESTMNMTPPITMIPQRHRNAMRDPNWFFDPWQWTTIAGIVAMAILPLASEVSSGVVLSTFAVIGLSPLACHAIFLALDRTRTSAAGAGQAEKWQGERNLMIGIDRQLRYTVKLGRRVLQGTFRSSLSETQWVALRSVLGLCIIILVVGRSAPAITSIVSALATGAALCTLSQYIQSRRLYRIGDGTLSVDIRQGWSTVCKESIPLGLAKIRCDFAAGFLTIAQQGASMSIPLGSLLHPHRFAATVLIAAGALEPGSASSQKRACDGEAGA